ncbi:MAG: sugar phosphate isomerase/epimerase family protein [Clostridia bacterium]|nr:sugar phosphate isomerase/epimerase family protein [Clostridia bacterium]
MSKVLLTGFGDEIDASLEKQLAFMSALGIHSIEARGVNGTNISSLTDCQVAEAKKTLNDYGFTVSALGSPIGKSDIREEFSKTLDAFQCTLDIAVKLNATGIRLFSFYVPNVTDDAYKDECIARLSRFKEAASDSDVILLLENETGLFGETPQHGLAIAKALCDEQFKLIFDPSNYVQRGWDVMQAWQLLRPYVGYMHIKDSVKLAEGTDAHSVNPHRVAGTGEAHVREILKDLKEENYQGYLSIEPHLTNSAYVSGTKPGKWAAAALALQTLLDEIGMDWQEG